MRETVVLHNVQAGHEQFVELWRGARAYLMTGRKLEVEVRPERRTSEQNSRLHAMLTEIAGQKDWAGAKRAVEVWKRLLVSAWLRARGESVEVLPALDGKGIDIVYSPTSQMTKTEMAELTTYIEAWAAGEGITLREPEQA